MDYYNEIDDYAASWIENLVFAGLVPDGHVDRRSIVEVTAADLSGYRQCHFFAGIAGWPLALQLAGWPDDREVWTGSCPCQPFSQAGEGKGFDDERHLWPHFFRLIRECRPASVLGEQVASKDAEPWLDLVWADLESVDYAFAALAFPSASVGAPHIRDRAYWLGHANDARLEGLRGGHRAAQGHGQATVRPTAKASGVVRVAERKGREAANGFWRDADWLLGRDAKWRPVEPGTFPLVDGFPGRMEQLRAYGNAINPHQAAEFIKAVMECQP